MEHLIVGLNNKCQIRLSLGCFELRKPKALKLFRKVEIYASLVKKLPGGVWTEIGQTERVQGTLNPVFFRQLLLDDSYCQISRDMYKINGGVRFFADLQKYELKVQVINQTSKTPEVIGECPIFFDDLKRCLQKRYTYELLSFEKDIFEPQVSGTLVINADLITIQSSIFDNVRFGLSARNVKNTEFFSMTDPFLLIYRPDQEFIPSVDHKKIPEDRWTLIHMTNVVKDFLNPDFEDWVDYPDNICRSFDLCWLRVEV